MNNNNYSTLAYNVSMLREYQNKPQPKIGVDEFQYETHPDTVFDYSIYQNTACGDVTAHELAAAEVDQAYKSRWFAFYETQPECLPHPAYVQRLFSYQTKLRKQIKSLIAPRLAVFSLAFVLIILLSARGHFALTLAPILGTFLFWLYTDKTFIQTQRQLQHNQSELLAVRAQYQALQTQITNLPLPASFESLNTKYHAALSTVLAKTIAHMIPSSSPYNAQALAQQKGWQVFAADSWGWLQLPSLPEDSTVRRFLLDEKHYSLSAYVPPSRSHNALYRISAFKVWVITPQGLLMGDALFDCVTDEFLTLQTALLTYSQIRQCELVEKLLPETSDLKQSLPSSIYQRYFRHPVPTLSIITNHGEHHTYVGVPARFTKQEQSAVRTLGLNGDLTQLSRVLNAKRVQQRPASAAVAAL